MIVMEKAQLKDRSFRCSYVEKCHSLDGLLAKIVFVGGLMLPGKYLSYCNDEASKCLEDLDVPCMCSA